GTLPTGRTMGDVKHLGGSFCPSGRAELHQRRHWPTQTGAAMSDMSILFTDAARDLPEQKLWSNIHTAHMRRRHAMDDLQYAIRVHGKDLNGEQLGALLSAFHGLRLL